jgi:hypothetical protein
MKLALTPSRTADGKTNGHRLGWTLYFTKERMNGLGSDGSWRGFRTNYHCYLLADRTTVILSNRGDFDSDAFWYKLNHLIQK